MLAEIDLKKRERQRQTENIILSEGEKEEGCRRRREIGRSSGRRRRGAHEQLISASKRDAGISTFCIP